MNIDECLHSVSESECDGDVCNDGFSFITTYGVAEERWNDGVVSGR